MGMDFLVGTPEENRESIKLSRLARSRPRG
jgi:hypothetical protein